MAIAIKIATGALTMIWGDIQVIGWGITAYFILLFIDAIMGAILAHRKGKKFDFGFFIAGPGWKVIFTCMMMFATAIVDRMACLNNTLVFGVVAFISMSGLLDVAAKYGELTGSELLVFLKDKASGFITKKEK